MQPDQPAFDQNRNPANDQNQDAARDKQSQPAPKRREDVETLEQRILLSATWVDADVDDADVDLDGELDGGGDPLEAAADADAAGAGQDDMFGDLGADPGTDFGDITELDSDLRMEAFSGVGTFRAGDSIFRLELEGEGTLDWSFDADSGSLKINDVDGTNGDTVLKLNALDGDGPQVRSIDLDGDLGRLESNLDLDRVHIERGADLGVLDVAGDIGQLKGHDLDADIHVGGTLESLEVQGTFGGQLEVDGNLEDFSADEVAADIHVHGNVNRFVVNAGGSNDDLHGKFVVDGDVDRFKVGDDLQGEVVIGGDVDRFEVGDDVRDGGRISIGGEAATLHVSGNLHADLTVEGGADSLRINQNVTGEVHLGGPAQQIHFGSMSGAKLDVDGSVEKFDADGACHNVEIDIAGDVGRLEARALDGDVHIHGDVHEVVVNAGGSNDDLRGTFTVDGRVDRMKVGDDVHAAVNISGDVGRFEVGDDVRDGGTLTFGGSAEHISIRGNLEHELTVNGAVDNLRIGDAVRGDVQIGGPVDDIHVGSMHGSQLTVDGGVGSFEADGACNDVVLDFNGDVGTFRADAVAGTVNVHGNIDAVVINAGGSNDDLRGAFTVDGDVGRMKVGDDVQGAVTIHGDVGDFEVGDDVRDGGTITLNGHADRVHIRGDMQTELTVRGPVQSLRINDNVGGTVSCAQTVHDIHFGSMSNATLDVGGEVRTLEVDGHCHDVKIDIAGDLGLLRSGSLVGDVHIQGDIDNVVINAGGSHDDLRGSFVVDGSVRNMKVGDDVQGNVQIAGDVHCFIVGDDVRDGGELHFGGNLDKLIVRGDLSTSVDVAGTTGTLTVRHQLSGSVHCGGGVDELDVGSMHNATVDIDGALGTWEADGRCENVELDVDGDVGAIRLGSLAGDVHLHGDVDVLRVNAGGSHDDLSGSLTVDGNMRRMHIGDDLKADVHIAGSVERLFVGDDVYNQAILQVDGDVDHLRVRDDVQGTLQLGGSVEKIMLGDLSGNVRTGGGVEQFVIKGRVSGADIQVGGDVDRFDAGRIDQTKLDFAGDIGRFDADRLDAQMEVTGSVDTLRVRAGGSHDDLAGSLHVHGSLGRLDVGDDIQGRVVIDGDADGIRARDDIRGNAEIQVGGNAGHIQARDDFDCDVDVAGDLDRFEAGDRFNGVLTVGRANGELTIHNGRLDHSRAYDVDTYVRYDGRMDTLTAEEAPPLPVETEADGSGRPSEDPVDAPVDPTDDQPTQPVAEEPTEDTQEPPADSHGDGAPDGAAEEPSAPAPDEPVAEQPADEGPAPVTDSAPAAPVAEQPSDPIDVAPELAPEAEQTPEAVPAPTAAAPTDTPPPADPEPAPAVADSADDDPAVEEPVLRNATPAAAESATGGDSDWTGDEQLEVMNARADFGDALEVPEATNAEDLAAAAESAQAPDDSRFVVEGTEYLRSDTDLTPTAVPPAAESDLTLPDEVTQANFDDAFVMERELTPTAAVDRDAAVESDGGNRSDDAVAAAGNTLQDDTYARAAGDRADGAAEANSGAPESSGIWAALWGLLRGGAGSQRDAGDRGRDS